MMALTRLIVALQGLIYRPQAKTKTTTFTLVNPRTGQIVSTREVKIPERADAHKVAQAIFRKMVLEAREDERRNFERLPVVWQRKK